MIRKILSIILLFTLNACSSNDEIKSNPITGKKSNPGLFSKDAEKGISLNDILNPPSSESSINVNGYLWRASINILSIAPLISADALGGIIITDWYVNKNIKNTRIKIMAHIKTSELRSDGISIKVHVQNLKNGVWAETYSNKELASQIENNILNEARNYRINSLNK